MLFRDDITRGHPPQWRPSTDGSWVGEIDFGRERAVSITDLREDIARGQVVSEYTVEGATGNAWRELARGTTVGYRKLDRFEPVRVHRLRVVVRAVAALEDRLELRAY